jgi:hypothetical protein
MTMRDKALWRHPQVCIIEQNRNNARGKNALALPMRTRNPPSIEVVFVETASKLMWYWNPTFSR